MNKQIDYFLFPNSPYAYLGHARLVLIARQHGAAINVKPMDAAKVFPVSGGLPLAKRAPQRLAYRLVELKRWREYLGVPLNLEPKFFPVAGDPSARLIIAAEEVSPAAALDIAGRVLKAVWAEDRNIADEATRVAIGNEAGLDGAALVARAQTEEIGARYDRYSQEAIDRQVFGAPTYFYRDEWFWGQDRLDFLERALVA
jgi:2-hydroxychromene-2-carboxylate isomerase